MTIVEEMLRPLARVVQPCERVALPVPTAELLNAIVTFLQRQMNDDGGFKGRGPASDLYYTVFGLQTLLGLQTDTPPPRHVREFLSRFGAGEELDLVHLGCLMRAWWLEAAMSRGREAIRRAMLEQLASFRSSDGGFSLLRGDPVSSVYAAFVAVAAFQDAGAPVPDPERLAGTVWAMQDADGGFANDAGFAVPTTPGTAAAVTTLCHLGQSPPESAVRWLLDRACPEGGFYAFDGAPEPDLLSTATALHAIEGANLSPTAQAGAAAELGKLADANRDFLFRLWTPAGGFRGSLSDDLPDVEYTFYGLLALGHLLRDDSFVNYS